MKKPIRKLLSVTCQEDRPSFHLYIEIDWDERLEVGDTVWCGDDVNLDVRSVHQFVLDPTKARHVEVCLQDVDGEAYDELLATGWVSENPMIVN